MSSTRKYLNHEEGFYEFLYCEVNRNAQDAPLLSYKDIERALSTLSEREQRLVRAVCSGSSRVDISKLEHISKGRVCEIYNKALRKLRHPSRLSGMTLDDYEEKLNYEKARNDRLETKLIELEDKFKELSQKAVINYEDVKDYVEIANADILEIPLEDLDLSVRSYNCLRRSYYVQESGTYINRTHIKHFIGMAQEDFYKIRNLGRKCLEEVFKKFDELGLIWDVNDEGIYTLQLVHKNKIHD